AVRVGLVDEIGGLEQAIAEARRRAGIPAGEKIRIAEFRRPRPPWIDALTNQVVSRAWSSATHLPEPGEPLYWDDEWGQKAPGGPSNPRAGLPHLRSRTPPPPEPAVWNGRSRSPSRHSSSCACSPRALRGCGSGA